METIIEAIYEQGVLHLREPLDVADGETVEVTIRTRDESAWDKLEAFFETSAVDTGIADLAHQHDHYLYGKPKKDSGG